jgi:hypothetical protein
LLLLLLLLLWSLRAAATTTAAAVVVDINFSATAFESDADSCAISLQCCC